MHPFRRGRVTVDTGAGCSDADTMRELLLKTLAVLKQNIKLLAVMTQQLSASGRLSSLWPKAACLPVACSFPYITFEALPQAMTSFLVCSHASAWTCLAISGQLVG